MTCCPPASLAPTTPLPPRGSQMRVPSALASGWAPGSSRCVVVLGAASKQRPPSPGAGLNAEQPWLLRLEPGGTGSACCHSCGQWRAGKTCMAPPRPLPCLQVCKFRGMDVISALTPVWARDATYWPYPGLVDGKPMWDTNVTIVSHPGSPGVGGPPSDPRCPPALACVGHRRLWLAASGLGHTLAVPYLLPA
jgi:hypothetical protein